MCRVSHPKPHTNVVIANTTVHILLTSHSFLFRVSFVRFSLPASEARSLRHSSDDLIFSHLSFGTSIWTVTMSELIKDPSITVINLYPPFSVLFYNFHFEYLNISFENVKIFLPELDKKGGIHNVYVYHNW